MDKFQFEIITFQSFKAIDKTALMALIHPIFTDFKVEKFERQIAELTSSERPPTQFMLIIAKSLDRWAGFKMGYTKSSELFYSWLGGVHPDFRRQGLALELMQRQHNWCRDAGFQKVRTHTLNQSKPMLLLNIKQGFDIITTTKKENHPIKVILEKTL